MPFNSVVSEYLSYCPSECCGFALCDDSGKLLFADAPFHQLLGLLQRQDPGRFTDAIIRDAIAAMQKKPSTVVDNMESPVALVERRFEPARVPASNDGEPFDLNAPIVATARMLLDPVSRVSRWLISIGPEGEGSVPQAANQIRPDCYQVMSEQAPNAIAMFDPQMTYLAVSDLWCEGVEMTREALLGRRHYELFPDIPDSLKQIHHRAMSGEKMFSPELLIIDVRGNPRWFRHFAQPWKDSEGNRGGILVLCEDITESKKAVATVEYERIATESALSQLAAYQETLEERVRLRTQDLEASERRQRLVGQLLYDQVFEWHHGDDRVQWFGDPGRALGYTDNQLGSQFHSWADYIHPDDQSRFLAACRSFSFGEERLHFEYRIRDSEGLYRCWCTDAIPAVIGDLGVMQWVGLCRDISAEISFRDALQHSACHDPLTGLPNRQLFSDYLNDAMALTQRLDSSLAVLLLDLDNFDQINEMLGYTGGNQVLLRIAQRIREYLRDRDQVARLGGDEFAITLVDFPTGDRGIALLEGLLGVINQPMTVDGKELSLTVSIGISVYEAGRVMSADQLLRQADRAMYLCKISGRNQFHFFDIHRDDKLRHRNNHIESVEVALEQGELFLMYQPKVNLLTGECIGAEALLRWQHPEYGVLLPGSFLQPVEEHELSARIGEWVICEALQQMRAWEKTGVSVPVSVNISAFHMKRRDFISRLEVVLGDISSLEEGMFQFEILESVLADDTAHIISVMKACKEMGITFALDDFGTGYSSLMYLKQLPANQLKIDQSFIRGLPSDKGNFAILQGIMGMARAFDLQVLAEGVENTAQCESLRILGCSLGQGFRFAKPLPADAFLSWLESSHPSISTPTGIDVF